MDSIDFHEILSANIDKLCQVTLKDNSVHSGIIRGVSHDGFGRLVGRIENKGKICSFYHTEVSDIYIYQ